MKFYQDMRDAVFEEIFEIAKRDKKVIILTADQGAQTFEKFKNQIPDQLINVGVAEQNMIGVASGMAKENFKVFLYAIIPFVTLRCLEQIKIDICCNNLPVNIIGIGSGYSYANDGPTHHATNDIGIMRTLPNLEIWNPSDSNSTSQIIPYLVKSKSPAYLRIDRGKVPEIYSNKNINLMEGFHILKECKNTTIISTGNMVDLSLKISSDLEKIGIPNGVIDCFRIKPLNKELLIKTLKKTKNIITIEENSMIGGLGSSISEILVDSFSNKKIFRYGTPDKFRWDLGGREILHKLDKIDRESIFLDLKNNLNQ